MVCGVGVYSRSASDIMALVAQAPAVSTAPAPAAPERPNLVSVGTVVWLSSELMFFASLFAIYFTIRAARPDVWEDRTQVLNVPWALTITIILLLSSVTCQFGVWAAERGQVGRIGGVMQVGKWGMREWFALTFILGSLFIAGQAFEYAELVVHEGITFSSDPFGSIFYLATGFHGIHVTLGLFAFLLVIGRTFMARRFTHEQATSAIVVSYYWHFVDVVWIGLFLTIYVIQ